MHLRKSTVLITGAAKRIGRHIALTLAQKGARILLHYNRSRSEAEQTADEIEKTGSSCVLIRADLSDPASITQMASEITRKHEKVDVLINNASAFFKTPLGSVSEKDWELLLNTNLKGPFFLSQVIGCRMKTNTGGAIVNIADWSGIKPYKDYGPYCASKGGLITLTKSLARDLAPKVRVNAVAPGPVLKPADMSDTEAGHIAGLTLLGRWGTPQDIANAAVLLIENDFMNGTVLVVDGGRSLL